MGEVDIGVRSCELSVLAVVFLLFFGDHKRGGTWAWPPPRGPPPETALARLGVRVCVCDDMRGVG